MAHAAQRVAKALLDKAGAEGLDPMKLLKLAYLSQGWMLGLYGTPLILDDVEAWRYGPVFREIYRNVAGQPMVRAIHVPRDSTFDEIETDLIGQVWEKYKDKSGLSLSALTHAPGSPWDITYQKFGQNAVIPKSLIQEYYAKKAA